MPNQLQWNSNQNTNIFIEENVFENALWNSNLDVDIFIKVNTTENVCKMSAILFLP